MIKKRIKRKPGPKIIGQKRQTYSFTLDPMANLLLRKLALVDRCSASKWLEKRILDEWNKNLN